ncbi:hypothetical protein [Runella sp.]|uniref:hypothetical protein n=1 Tax=Runella sp. TaxID=1960881 RepID=UPI003D0F5758
MLYLIGLLLFIITLFYILSKSKKNKQNVSKYLIYKKEEIANLPSNNLNSYFSSGYHNKDTEELLSQSKSEPILEKIKVDFSLQSNNVNSHFNSDYYNNHIEELLYKTIEIRHFAIRGIRFRENITESDTGFFVGHAICEDNYHDKYAVAIFRNDGKQLGYTPKNNKRLDDSIKKWHSGKILCWGIIGYDNYNNIWGGDVYIPVGMPEDTINMIHEIIRRKERLSILLKEKPASIENSLNALKIHQEIKELTKITPKFDGLNHVFPKTLIPSLSKHLEKEKMWSKLIELEQYKDEIQNLSSVMASSTLQRINKAKEFLNIKE